MINGLSTLLNIYYVPVSRNFIKKHTKIQKTATSAIFDELFEILTWAQLGIHSRPIGLLNTEGFFTPLLVWLEKVVVEQGFVKSKHAKELLMVERSTESLLDRLACSRGFHSPPSSPADPDLR